MSTIKVSAIQDLSGGQNVNVPNAAKAWVNFNGEGTVTIRSDYNVSSITDNTTGDYTVNFTTAMADVNYSFNVNNYVGDDLGAGSAGYSRTISVGSSDVTTSALTFVVYGHFPGFFGTKDTPNVCVTIFR